MSKKGFKEFFYLVATNSEVAGKIAEAGTDAEKIIAVGKDYGYEFGVSDLKSFNKDLSRAEEKFSAGELEKQQINKGLKVQVVGQASNAIGSAALGVSVM